MYYSSGLCILYLTFSKVCSLVFSAAKTAAGEAGKAVGRASAAAKTAKVGQIQVAIQHGQAKKVLEQAKKDQVSVEFLNDFK